MDKRTITALALMLILYLAFDQFVWKPQRENAKLARLKESTEEVVSIPNAEEKSESVSTQSAIQPIDSLVVTSNPEEILTLENEHLIVKLSTIGAAITALELKQYDFVKGKRVDLVPDSSTLAGTSIVHGSGTTDLSSRSFNYTIDATGKGITFYIGDAQAPQISKHYSLDDQYGISLDIKTENWMAVNGLKLDFGAGIADSEKNVKSKAQDYRFYLYADNEIVKVPLSKMKKHPPSGSVGSFAWAALRTKYFAIALREHEPSLSRNYTSSINSTTLNPAFTLDSIHKESKSTWHQSFTIYAGPADPEILKTYGRQMENIAERGANWLRWLANIFAWFLNWLHKYVRNYGVVIIIFALLLKVILHPLTHKSMDASLKMQRIQPQLQALQAKYKNDPKTLQVEMSKLYKEAGANPLSGCLPLLLQMPIFFSLYSVLRYSLDMRNAGFVLWLKDLSEPDPYMILPIIMGVFMIVQSLMMQPKRGNPEEMDDKQRAAQSSQKMMTWMMPIMMFFIFRNMPAGLVLYWTVFNIFSVIQQYYLQKRYNKE